MRVLMTGVSSGIGAGIAISLLKQGWSITGIDAKQPQAPTIEYHCLDLSNLQLLAEFLDEHQNEYDALINCAGIREICNPCDLSLDEWTRVMNVNVGACFVLAQSVIKKAIKSQKKLSIVNIASISGLQAEQDRAAYITSKFGLIGLTKQLAFQFGQQGIRTNAIAPGVIETPLTQDYFKDEAHAAKIRRSTPVGYWGQVEHLLPLVDLCLNNTYMNGAVLVCDGGWTTGKEI